MHFVKRVIFLIPLLLVVSFLAFALVQPGILIQDSWRFVFFADGRPEMAAANDVVWAKMRSLSDGAKLASERLFKH